MRTPIIYFSLSVFLSLGGESSRRELPAVHHLCRVFGLQRSSLWMVCPPQPVSATHTRVTLTHSTPVPITRSPAGCIMEVFERSALGVLAEHPHE